MKNPRSLVSQAAWPVDAPEPSNHVAVTREFSPLGTAKVMFQDACFTCAGL